MVEQKGERVVNGRKTDDVDVVEADDLLFRRARDRVDEGGQDGLNRRRLRSVEQGQRAVYETRVQALQCGDEVGPELAGIVVALVQREPGDRRLGVENPLAEQGRLPEPGRCGDQGQLAGKSGVEAFVQARPRDQVRPQTRNE
jgi:hypothetical protein